MTGLEPRSLIAKPKVKVALTAVAVLAVAGLAVWWFTGGRLPDEVTVGTADGRDRAPGSVSRWAATGDRLGDRRLLRDAHRAWMDHVEDSRESFQPDSGILPGPGEQTAVRVVFAGDVAGWRQVVMVTEDGAAAARYSERRVGDRQRLLTAWGGRQTPLGSSVPPVAPLSGRQPAYLVHPDVTRLQAAIPNDVTVADASDGGSPDGDDVRWVDAPVDEGLATPDPDTWPGDCGRPVLRAHLAGGGTVTVLDGGSRSFLPVAPEHVSTPAQVMTLTDAACRLPGSPVRQITVEELWSGELPGIDHVRGAASALWVRAASFGGEYADGDATDYGVLVYATDARPAAPHFLAQRPSYASVRPRLVAGLVSGGPSESSHYVAIGDESVERIELVGSGGTRAPERVREPGRVAVVPVEPWAGGPSAR